MILQGRSKSVSPICVNNFLEERVTQFRVRYSRQIIFAKQPIQRNRSMLEEPLMSNLLMFEAWIAIAEVPVRLVLERLIFPYVRLEEVFGDFS